MGNLIEEPGFEEVPSTWVLGTTCPVGTAVIQGSVVRSGALALQITRVTIGGVQRCGYAERLVTGIVPGRFYRIKVWHRTAALASSGVVQILVGGVQKGIFATNSLSWISFTTNQFTVPTTSAMLRLQVPGSGVTTTHVRYLDDLEWDSADPIDAATPAGLSGRAAVSDPSSIAGAGAAENRVSASMSSLAVQLSVRSLAARATMKKP
jgi:hypothetical protein